MEIEFALDIDHIELLYEYFIHVFQTELVILNIEMFLSDPEKLSIIELRVRSPSSLAHSSAFVSSCYKMYDGDKL